MYYLHWCRVVHVAGMAFILSGGIPWSTMDYTMLLLYNARHSVVVIVAVVAAGVARRRWEASELLFTRPETLQCYLLKSVGLLDYEGRHAAPSLRGCAENERYIHLFSLSLSVSLLANYFVREMVTYGGGSRTWLNRDVNWPPRCIARLHFSRAPRGWIDGVGSGDL